MSLFKKRKKESSPKKEDKWFESEGELAIDFYQTDDEFVVQAAVAGLKTKDFDISIENDILTIKGKREKPKEEKKANYFYQECYWGPFSREVMLSEETDPKHIKATMKQGILTIRIPKLEKEKKRKIDIGG